MTFEELAGPSLPRLAGRIAPALKDFYESIRMPALPAALMIGVPLAIATGLLALKHDHALININLAYYPLFIFVYAIWVFPILGFLLFSGRQHEPHPEAPPKTRFLCLIPAYNERSVIANSVRSLLAQDYPEELRDVYVVFDGTDDTAEIASDLGAKVLVTRTPGSGKHEVLRYAVAELLGEDDDRYVCVFDADNVVGSNFCRAVNNAIQAKGYECVQAFHNVLNGSKNWITKALWISTVSSSSIYLAGRMRSLRNVLICGTGWCCKGTLLRKYWRMTRTQTEDIEFNGILALQEGIGVGYVPEAEFYDEKPVNLWIAIRQRTRWMVGHTHVCWHYFWPCLIRGVRSRNIALIELAMYYLVPFALAASFLSCPLLVGLSSHIFKISGPLAWRPVAYPLEGASIFLVLFYQVVGFYAYDVRVRTRPLYIGRVALYTIYSNLFALVAWAPALVWAGFALARRDWIFHTPHEANSVDGNPVLGLFPNVENAIQSPPSVIVASVSREEVQYVESSMPYAPNVMVTSPLPQEVMQ